MTELVCVVTAGDMHAYHLMNDINMQFLLGSLKNQMKASHPGGMSCLYQFDSNC